MNNYKKKIIIILSSVFVIVLLTLITIFLPSGFSKLKGETNMEKLGIEDENLYACILLESIFMDEFSNLDLSYDKYENFVTEVTFEDAIGAPLLEDEQRVKDFLNKMNYEVTENDLKNITSLECANVKNFKGIEKLENLEELYLKGNLGDLNLSKNTKLEDLYIEGNLNNIKISNENLKRLEIENVKINNLEIANESNVNFINIGYSMIDNFVFNNDNNINSLYIYSSEINNFDFSKTSKLTSLSLSDSNFDNVDLSNNKNISNISIRNGVKSVVIPNSNQSNYSVNINSDELENIRFLENTNINYLSINSKKLSSLDFTNITNIRDVSLNTPNLKQLKFKENSSYETFSIRDLDLDLLDISTVNIKSLQMSESFINNVKIKNDDTLPSYLPYDLNKIEFYDGSYIELNSENVLIDEDKVILKKANITLNDIINTNNIFKSSGVNFKVCKTVYGPYGSSCTEITDVNTIISNLSDKKLQIYKNNVEIGNYTIGLFDNEFFDDYYLYKEIVNRYSSRVDTSKNLTDEEFNSIKYISLNKRYIKSFKGLEKLTGVTSLSISSDLIQYLTLFSNLKELSIEDMSEYDTKIDNLDIANFVGLETLYIHSNNIKKLSLSNLPSLKDLDISSSNIESLSLFEDGSQNELKRIEISNTPLEYINIDNVLKLERLYVRSSNLENINLSKNTMLTYLNLSHNKLQYLDLSNNKLLTSLDLEDNLIKTLDIKNNKELEYIDIEDNQIEELDFSENEKIKTEESIYYDDNPIKKLYGIKNILTESSTLALEVPTLEEIDLSGCGELEEIAILSNNLKKIDLKDCTSLVSLMIASPKLDKIENIDIAKQLMIFAAPFTNIKEMDLSNLENLMYIIVPFTPATKNSINILKGTSKELKFKVKFPAQMTLEHYNEDDYIARYDESTNMIVANHPGQSVITTYMPTIDLDGNETNGFLKTYLNVYDIESKKVLINKEYKYIFNYNNETNKVLNRYIKVYGEDVSKKIEGNKLYMYSNEDKIFTFDILEFTSDDYKIDNEKNIIYYSDAFDISKLKVVNGTLNKIDNELQLICNDSIVKTYKLEKK